MIWVRHCTVTGLSYRDCRAGCCFTSGLMSTALQITLMNFLNCNVKSKFWSALLKTQLLKNASVLVNPVKGRCFMILRNSSKEIPVCVLLYSRFICLDGGQTATPHWDCNGPLTTGAGTTHCEPPLEQRPNAIKRLLTTEKLEGVCSATQFLITTLCWCPADTPNVACLLQLSLD